MRDEKLVETLCELEFVKNGFMRKKMKKSLRQITETFMQIQVFLPVLITYESVIRVFTYFLFITVFILKQNILNKNRLN